jgi:S1-C subfamily serine protease
MFKKLLTTLLFSLASISATAQALHPSYVSIKMKSDALDMAPLERSICGGVVVDEVRRLVATAWHCVPNQRSTIEKAGIFSIGGMEAKFVSYSPEADIALFEVSDLKGLKAPEFRTPMRGDKVVASAYYDSFNVLAPANDRFTPPMSIKAILEWEAKVAAVAKASRLSGERYDQPIETNITWIVVSSNPAQGFSGGPAFDKNGNFIGIISNANGGFTNISSSENIKQMIEDLKK